MSRATYLCALSPLFALFALSALGCTAAIPDGRFACASTSECPPGQTCDAHGVCRTHASDVDAATDAGARLDAMHACTSAAQCDDGVFCNGVEACSAGSCAAGSIPCTASQACHESTQTCTDVTCHTDGDGDGAIAQSCGGPDCDDADRSVHPGATETCNGIDDDCDGVVDCASRPSAMFTCSAGACVYACMTGHVTCDTADPGDASGCEVTGSSCTIAPPRAIGPLDEMLLTGAKPTFRFALPASTTSAHLEVCDSATCSHVVAMTDGTSPLTVPPLPPGHFFWRLQGRSSSGTDVGSPSAPWGLWIQAHAADGAATYDAFPYLDVDAMTPDMVIGAPATSGGGAVFFYDDATTGAVPAWMNGTTGFGSSVAAAGDVDGDGFGDVIVGACIASWHDTETPTIGCANAAFLYRSLGNGMFASPVTISSPAGAASGFGSVVSSAGDFNGDGYGDVIIGAPFDGKAFLYFGSPAGLDLVDFLALGGGSARFGADVAAAGDMNGDGFGDVIVGSPGSGHAGIYLGSAATTPPAPIMLGDGTPGFGASVSSVGDWNRDGFADVAVAVEGTNTGSVRVFTGNAGLSPTLGPTTWTVDTVPDASGTASATSVLGIGDCNGDGLGDLVVGTSSSVAGTFTMFHGGPDTGSSGTIGHVTATTAYFASRFGRLAGPHFVVSSCRTPALCSVTEVDAYDCAMTRTASWINGTANFGYGVPR